MPKGSHGERAQPRPEDAASPEANPPQTERRQSVVDRRLDSTGLERRRGPGRRRTDFVKAAEEGEMSQEQFLFLKAIDAYKRVNNRPYPTWSEVLEVIRKLGYRKTASMDLHLPAVEDWTEPPDAPAFTDDQASESDENDPSQA
ncbi:MAG: hypothetical protein ACODAQ_04255 [Phycisphaeraceae bacterium]